MPTIVFIALCASLVVGVMLVWIGRRGRKLNDHPVCRWCGFDVSGTYPASYMCPECGGGLKREHGVRIGVRRRMPLVEVVGVLMVLLPLAPMGIAFYGVITGSNLNKWKPVGMLMWEAGMVGKPASEAIAKELVDRMTLKTLDRDQEATIAARVVEFQKDVGFAWTDGWGEVCDQLKLHDAFNDKQWFSIAEYALVDLTLRTRGEVRAGETLALTVTPSALRIPASAQWTGTMYYQSPMLGGRPLARPAKPLRAQLGRANGLDVLGAFQVLGPTAFGGRPGTPVTHAEDLSIGAVLQLPSDLEPGEHEVRIDVYPRCNDRRIPPMNRPADTPRPWRTLSARIRVVQPDGGSARAIEPTPAETERVRSAMSELRVQLFDMLADNPSRARFNQPRYSITVMLPKLPEDLPLACEVFAVVDGHEVPLGPLAQGELVESAFMRGQFIGKMNYLSTTSNDPWWGEVDLIFRPNPAVALATLGMTQYYAGEIIIKDVQVVDQYNKPVAEPPKSEPAKANAPTPSDEPTKPAGKP